LLVRWVVGEAGSDGCLSHSRMPSLRGRALPVLPLCAWALSVRGSTPRACRRDARIRVICPMPAAS
jgi:hypothetical protein